MTSQEKKKIIDELIAEVKFREEHVKEHITISFENEVAYRTGVTDQYFISRFPERFQKNDPDDSFFVVIFLGNLKRVLFYVNLNFAGASFYVGDGSYNVTECWEIITYLEDTFLPWVFGRIFTGVVAAKKYGV